MEWITFVILSILFASISRILQKMLFKEEKADPILGAVSFQYAVCLIILIYSLFTGFNLNGYENYIHLLIISGLVYALGNVLMFKAFKIAQASQVTIALSSTAIWTVMASIILLKETLTIVVIVGICLVVFSLILTNINGENKINLKKKGIIYSLAAAVLFGIGFTIDALAIGDRDVDSYLVLAFFLPATFVFIYYFKHIQKVIKVKSSINYREIILTSVLYAFSNIFIFTAYQAGGNASIISPLQQVSTILTVILAILFLKERDNIKFKIVASIISIIGVILLVL